MRSTSVVVVAGIGSLIAYELVAIVGSLFAHPSTPAMPASTPAPVITAPWAIPIAPLRIAPPPRPFPSLCARRIPLDDKTGEPSLPPLHPERYAAWLRTRSQDQRARIAARCRAHPVNYDRMCGGIGPLHIPMPPCIVSLHAPSPDEPKLPASPYASSEEWRAAMTPAQRRYVADHCRPSESRPSSDLCGPNTPLVVAFDNQPVLFSTGGVFAFAPGEPAASDFPTAATPWLALDRDHNGAIDSGAELFGSGTN